MSEQNRQVFVIGTRPMPVSDVSWNGMAGRKSPLPASTTKVFVFLTLDGGKGQSRWLVKPELCPGN